MYMFNILFNSDGGRSIINVYNIVLIQLHIYFIIKKNRLFDS